MKKYIRLLLICCCFVLSACGEEFLDAKPSSDIINPTTIAEYQKLLDHYLILNATGALPQLSSDEYYIVSNKDYEALPSNTQKNAYIWKEDIYDGEVEIPAWNRLYACVFYANSVLDGLENIEVTSANRDSWEDLRGQALFFRSYAFYDLARNFCSVYDDETADSELGIPLKISSGIDKIVPRSTLSETFEQIIKDLMESKELLGNSFSEGNRNRPSRAAVFALLARVYLYMGKYADAELAADSCLKHYNKLIDYNTVDASSSQPFTYTNDEVIFYSAQVISYSTTTGYDNKPAIAVDTNLIELYHEDDLRLSIFFLKNSIGNYNVKRGYAGGGSYPFTGLAVDEVYLIKSECMARRNDAQGAMSFLNALLTNRYKTNSYVPMVVSSATEALEKILLERRKELVWRALRWSDLKRLNRDGANITLTRLIGGEEFILPPNSSLYVFPIPDDETLLSGIQQNNR